MGSPVQNSTKPKQKQAQGWMWLVMEVNLCWKEQYCIGIWDVRSTIQGKLEVVKQEMARVNIDILGVSELKWTGMDKFNSDDHVGKYPSEEME